MSAAQGIMIEIIVFIQSFSNSFLDSFFQLVTMIGEDMFFILMVALVFWCIDKDFGYKMGFAYLTSGVVNTVLKEMLKVPRPIGHPDVRSLRVETAGGYSFPSGHTQQTTVFWFSLMLKFRKQWLSILGSVIVFLVGLSRIYLGVHTPLDVVGGIIIALVWVIISNLLFDWSKQSGKPILLAVFVVPMLIGLYLFPTETYYKVAGTISGFWLGYMIEFRYINYSVKGTIVRQIIKMVLGLAGLLSIQTFVKMLLPEVLLSDFVRYGLMGLWMTVVAPLLFNFIFRETKSDQSPTIPG
ncbi:MAG: phosphatase PAP2 family protein [Clostridiales bacterium]|nr:phosphatase PAP2 family protein [Clostridiales bacterium]